VGMDNLMFQLAVRPWVAQSEDIDQTIQIPYIQNAAHTQIKLFSNDLIYALKPKKYGKTIHVLKRINYQLYFSKYMIRKYGL
jgi:hypothetical protein